MVMNLVTVVVSGNIFSQIVKLYYLSPFTLIFPFSVLGLLTYFAFISIRGRHRPIQTDASVIPSQFTNSGPLPLVPNVDIQSPISSRMRNRRQSLAHGVELLHEIKSNAKRRVALTPLQTAILQIEMSSSDSSSDVENVLNCVSDESSDSSSELSSSSALTSTISSFSESEHIAVPPQLSFFAET